MINVLRVSDAHIKTGCPICERGLVTIEQDNLSMHDHSLKAGDSVYLELTEDQKHGVTFDAGLLLGTCPYCEESYCVPYLVILEGDGHEAMETVKFNRKLERTEMLIAHQRGETWGLELFNSEQGIVHLHRFGFWPSEENPCIPWDKAVKHIANMFDACKNLITDSKPDDKLKTSKADQSNVDEPSLNNAIFYIVLFNQVGTKFDGLKEIPIYLNRNKEAVAMIKNEHGDECERSFNDVKKDLSDNNVIFEIGFKQKEK